MASCAVTEDFPTPPLPDRTFEIRNLKEFLATLLLSRVFYRKEEGGKQKVSDIVSVPVSSA
jgi:hypothetical protein